MTLTPLPESVSSVCESVPAGMRTFRSSYKPLKIIFRLKQFQDYFRFKTFQIIRSLVLKKIILGQVHSIIFRFKPFQIILGFTFNPPFHDYSLTNKNVLSALFFAWCSILNVNIDGKTFGKGKKKSGLYITFFNCSLKGNFFAGCRGVYGAFSQGLGLGRDQSYFNCCDPPQGPSNEARMLQGSRDPLVYLYCVCNLHNLTSIRYISRPNHFFLQFPSMCW